MRVIIEVGPLLTIIIILVIIMIVLCYPRLDMALEIIIDNNNLITRVSLPCPGDPGNEVAQTTVQFMICDIN